MHHYNPPNQYTVYTQWGLSWVLCELYCVCMPYANLLDAFERLFCIHLGMNSHLCALELSL